MDEEHQSQYIRFEFLNTKFSNKLMNKVRQPIELNLIRMFLKLLLSPPYPTLLSYFIAEVRKVFHDLMWPSHTSCIFADFKVLKTDKWPVTKNTLISMYQKLFKRFVDSIDFEKLQSDETRI